MRVLITGITGFAGGFLAEALLARGQVQLLGLSRRGEWPIELWHLQNWVDLSACDLSDGKMIEEQVRQFAPEQIYHLAGYAHVGQSFREPLAAWAGNLTATLALYEAVSRWAKGCRILFVSSGQIYGEPATPEQAFQEGAPLRPTSPYAASKAAADLASFQYTRSPGLDIVRVRPFNHVGPRQSPQFAVAHFAQQIAAIERGQRPPILETGNLKPLRDLTDVRDMVQGYVSLMERGKTGEVYNAAAGEVHSMEVVLNRLLKMARAQVEIRQKPDQVRTTETSAIRADAGKLRRETGWAPRYSLDQTLTDTLEFWRHQP
jgi:GDP-4-dehydro-6-deoxy-D-mannose reductase